MLEAKEITVWRGELLLLDTLSFDIKAGTALQVQGDNGSGKTTCLLYTSPSPRDRTRSRMPSSA